MCCSENDQPTAPDSLVLLGLTDWPDTEKEDDVAKEISCPCGETVRGETDDELVRATEEHMREKHPEMVGTKSRQDILEMAHDA